MGHQYRFTLIHDSGTQEISEPEGWKDIKITLERDKDYFGVFELFETPMVFYGRNQRFDGGYDFLEDINTTYGPDAQVHIYIEIKPNTGDLFEPFFTGLLDNSARKKMDSRKIQIPVIQNDFIAKFKSRSGTSVNINSAKDLADADVTDPTSGNNQIQLTTQLIRKNYIGEQKYNVYDRTDLPPDYRVIDFDNEILSEIDEKYHYQYQSTDTKPFGLFTFLEDGVYDFDCKITMAQRLNANIVFSFPAASGTGDVVFFQLNSNTPIPFTRTDRNVENSVTLNNGTVITPPFPDQRSVSDFTFTASLKLNKNDTVRIYAFNTVLAGNMFIGNQGWAHEDFSGIENYAFPTGGAGYNAANGPPFQGYWDASLNTYPNNGDASVKLGFSWLISTPGVLGGVPVLKDYALQALVDNPGTTAANWWAAPKHLYEGLEAYGQTHLNVQGNTSYGETTSKAFFIHDVAQKILERITEQSVVSPFYSEYLGGVHTLGSYPDDGCATHLMVTQGLQLRQYTLADKAFSISFNDWWQGVNPILNLGLCYDTIDDNLVIRVEDKAFFFEDDIFLYLVQEDYDLENIFNKIKIGYTTWKSEDISGIDDPQTTHQYSTVFKTVGKEIDIESGFIAASLAIEQTRRTTIQKSQDYKFDNNVFIIWVKPDEATSPPDTFLPQLDENYNSVSNLLNSSTRYNLILTPARALFRWGNFLNGCLMRNLNTPYKFTYGEGNYAMSSDYSGSAPEVCLAVTGDPLSEGQDINLTGPAYLGLVGHLFQPIVYTFTYPLTYAQYKLIKANRHKAIGVSETNSDHITCFIKKIEYDINKSKAIFTLWKR